MQVMPVRANPGTQEVHVLEVPWQVAQLSVQAEQFNNREVGLTLLVRSTLCYEIYPGLHSVHISELMQFAHSKGQLTQILLLK